MLAIQPKTKGTTIQHAIQNGVAHYLHLSSLVGDCFLLHLSFVLQQRDFQLLLLLLFCRFLELFLLTSTESFQKCIGLDEKQNPRSQTTREQQDHEYSTTSLVFSRLLIVIGHDKLPG